MVKKVLSLISLIVAVHSLDTRADARLIVHLTDYLANDYAGAVSEERKILSQGEYDEQVEFSQHVLEAGRKEPKINGDAQLMAKLYDLSHSIREKNPPSVVVPQARFIQKEVIRISGIALSPKSWPDLNRGKVLFDQNCVSCHGRDGRGDGPDGVDLDPKPANFHDEERGQLLSPFAAFNTIRLGVSGTGMPSFDLPDEDIWALAFYVNSFRHGGATPAVASLKFADEDLLSKVSSMSDPELLAHLEGKGEAAAENLRKVRTQVVALGPTDHLSRTAALLSEALAAMREGKKDLAVKLALESYLKGIEPIEHKISATDSSFVTRIENAMARFREALKTEDEGQTMTAHAAVLTELGAIRQLLSGSKTTPAVAFTSGFSIILREGFEAVLVILAILGVGKASNSKVVVGAIHSGWITSLVLGIGGWFLSGWLIELSGMGREMMEGFTSLFAVFVLLFVGFWMHRQTELKRWQEFINVKVRNLTQAKNLVGLFALSFIVSFREVIETVLFLRSVASESEAGTNTYLLAGVVLAFAIIFVVSVLITRYRNKVSLQKYFNLSSVLMMALATVLAGKGVHSLQEAGVVEVSIFPVNLRSEYLGIYPSWQVILTQLIVLTLAVVTWKTARKKAT